jgi:hypothetical protein
MILVGCGFGVSYSFITQRVMGTAEPGQEDATIAAMSTLFGMGGAISAAVSGLIGNSVGLDGPLTSDVVDTASLILFGGGALLAILGIVCAWRLTHAYAAHQRAAH